MNSKLLAGSTLAYVYNHLMTCVPFHCMRRTYLQCYLGRVGEGSQIQMSCRFLQGRKIYLGKRNIINFGCLFDGRRFSIRTGDDVSIGPEAAILTLGHDPQSASFADRGGEVTINNKVWIGFRALVLPGVTIGEGAVVGAGAVVTKSIDPYAIVAGSPARKIGERNPNLDYRLDYKPFLV